MAYSEELAGSVRAALVDTQGIEERKMFGGVCFLLKGKMICGVLNEDLMARVDPADSDKLLKKAGVRPMDFTGRPMKGFLYVDKKGYGKSGALKDWIGLTLKYVSGLPEKRPKPSRPKKRTRK